MFEGICPNLAAKVFEKTENFGGILLNLAGIY
jgi:hypothetical protein